MTCNNVYVSTHLYMLAYCVPGSAVISPDGNFPLVNICPLGNLVRKVWVCINSLVLKYEVLYDKFTRYSRYSIEEEFIVDGEIREGIRKG